MEGKGKETGGVLCVRDWGEGGVGVGGGGAGSRAQNH